MPILEYRQSALLDTGLLLIMVMQHVDHNLRIKLSSAGKVIQRTDISPSIRLGVL